MLKHDQYVFFKERSRRHMIATLRSFEFWGEKIGRIRGDIKEKYGEARWYADLGPSSLFELINVSAAYRQPKESVKFKLLNMLDYISVNLFFLRYFVIFYKLLFYNVAYTVAMLKNPDCAKDIVFSADHPKKILLAKPIIFTASVFYRVKKFISRSGRLK